MDGIGQFSGVALECPDPQALAEFYSRLTGWPITYSSTEWVSIGEDATWHLSFQRSHDYQPPTWPDPSSSMQAHLHVRVPDLDSAESAVLHLGATKFATQPHPDTSRVYADPAGHGFCVVLGPVNP